MKRQILWVMIGVWIQAARLLARLVLLIQINFHTGHKYLAYGGDKFLSNNKLLNTIYAILL